MMNKEKTIGWNFDNSYSNLPKSFIYEISPVPVKRQGLVIFMMVMPWMLSPEPAPPARPRGRRPGGG